MCFLQEVASQTSHEHAHTLRRVLEYDAAQGRCAPVVCAFFRCSPFSVLLARPWMVARFLSPSLTVCGSEFSEADIKQCSAPICQNDTEW